MNWKSIRLELASTDDFPTGSVGRAYLIRIPLNDEDAIDEAALELSPSKAVVRRHWSAEPDERGLLVRADGDWSIRCDGKSRRLSLKSQPIRLGGHVAVIEPDGDVLPFTIASIR
jgi:hypothetical protein